MKLLSWDQISPRGTEWKFAHYVNTSGVGFTSVVISLCKTVDRKVCMSLYVSPEAHLHTVNQCLALPSG